MGCGLWGDYLCSGCVNKLRPAMQVCPTCGRGSIYGVVHTKCRSRYGMDGVVRVVAYRGIVRRIIAKIKYRLVADMVGTVVETVVSLSDLAPIDQKKWLVVPVPLSAARKRWRGFNQAEEIGRRVAAEFGWDYGEVLVRVVDTKPQVSMKDREKRLANVKGAFEISNKLQVTSYKLGQKNILLIDDVWTTGATMRECAKVLKRAGVGEVWGLAAAG